MSRMIGFLVFLLFFIFGCAWAHYYAKENWANPSDVAAVGFAKGGEQVTYTHPLDESRRLYQGANTLWRAEDSDAAIERLEESIKSADQVEKNNKEFFNNKDSRSDLNEWQAHLQETLKTWRQSKAGVADNDAQKFATSDEDQPYDSEFVDATAEVYKGSTSSSQPSSTASSVVEELDQAAGGEVSIIGTPPPPLDRNKVETITIEAEEDDSPEFAENNIGKTQMWINGYNAFANGEDYMEANEREYALDSYRKSKAWFDALSQKFPQYQSQSVQQRRDELSRKIGSLEE